ncbi:MAG: metal-binding protein [Cycloclasticus sp.]|nr:MAG: metal-binding protein [Cycloclasticus sp.]
MNNRFIKQGLIILFVMSVAACSDNEVSVEKVVVPVGAVNSVELDVFKSPTCDCCGRWVSYIDEKGFGATTHHPADLNLVKQKLGIAPQYQSCHTGVSKEGYIFEGHVPADIMQRFLAEKPENALGLAVPGMPIGSPGMEMGDQRDDYDVLLLNKDGSAEVYERIRLGV